VSTGAAVAVKLAGEFRGTGTGVDLRHKYFFLEIRRPFWREQDDGRCHQATGARETPSALFKVRFAAARSGRELVDRCPRWCVVRWHTADGEPRQAPFVKNRSCVYQRAGIIAPVTIRVPHQRQATSAETGPPGHDGSPGRQPSGLALTATPCTPGFWPAFREGRIRMAPPDCVPSSRGYESTRRDGGVGWSYPS